MSNHVLARLAHPDDLETKLVVELRPDGNITIAVDGGKYAGEVWPFILTKIFARELHDILGKFINDQIYVCPRKNPM